MRTVCGSEFQTVGAEDWKARLEKSVLMNGLSSRGMTAERIVRQHHSAIRRCSGRAPNFVCHNCQLGVEQYFVCISLRAIFIRRVLIRVDMQQRCVWTQQHPQLWAVQSLKGRQRSGTIFYLHMSYSLWKHIRQSQSGISQVM